MNNVRIRHLIQVILALAGLFSASGAPLDHHTLSIGISPLFNSRALVEVASKKSGFSSEPSYGTHFFQDLVESQIYPLAVHSEEPGDHLNWDFIRQSKNQMSTFFPEPTQANRCIKVIHIPSERPGHYLEMIMDGQTGLGYLAPSKA